MRTSSQALKLGGFALVASVFLTGCGGLSSLTDIVIPNFSDENLGNPMADFMPSGGGTPVANQSAAAGSAPSTAPEAFAPASVGLLDRAALAGVGSANAALLDAALDVSPSQMGATGASSGLLDSAALSLVNRPNTGLQAGSGALVAATDPVAPAPRPLLDAAPTAAAATANSSFELLSPEEAERMIDEAGTMLYTVVEQNAVAAQGQNQILKPAPAGLLPFGQPPAVAGLAAPPALAMPTGLTPPQNLTAVGTSPEIAMIVPDAGPNASGSSFDLADIPAMTPRASQALIPVYGGSQRLSVQPTAGSLQPGFAQYRAGGIEFTLTYPAQIAVARLYAPVTPSVTLTMRNIDSVPKTFQPDNILNQFPPFEVYRWTGSVWASLTMDVAYNLDRQGISAPVTLQPGQSTTRSEPLAKLALLPLKVDLPPTSGLAIRLRVMGQPDAFTMVDSGFLPIRITDSGAFPMATTMTLDAEPTFVRVNDATVLPTPVLTR